MKNNHMILRKKKKQIDASILFPTINDFIEHVLTLDKNLRNQNDFIKNEFKILYDKFLSFDDIIDYCSIKSWLKKNYQFKTTKYGSIQYWIERGWNKIDAELILQKRNKNTKERNINCVQYWVKKGYTENEAKNIISKKQRDLSKKVKNRVLITKDYLKSKNLNDNEINNLTRKRSILCIEYWLDKGCSENDARSKISEIQTKNSLKSLQKKYDDFKEYKKTKTTNIEYWLNKGYSIEDAKLKLINRQRTFTLEKCKLKYGEELGIIKFKERQEKWKKSLNNSNGLKRGFSYISQELFYHILEIYENKDKKNVFFATKNEEFSLFGNGKTYFYDFTDTKKKKIIEFNGDLFHGNPNIFDKNDNPNPFNKNIIAEDLWKKDKDKINIANNNGYDVFIVWESEYKQNKNKIISNCIKYLKYEKNN